MSLPPKLFITSIMIPTVITVLSAVLFQLAAGGAVQKRAAAVNYDLNDLPKSNVHYLWDSTLDDATAIKKCMTLAMKQISDVSCVKFVNTNDNNPPRDSGFIVFSLNIKDKACHSFIRLTHGIGTQVSMGRKCGVVVAQNEKLPRIRWNVLNWNEGAKQFYKKMGAEDLGDEDWLTYTLKPTEIKALATI